MAGGMESMSNVPYYAPSSAHGARMGNVELMDGMVYDGLIDVYDQRPHGHLRRGLRRAVQSISRAAQDEFARRVHPPRHQRPEGGRSSRRRSSRSRSAQKKGEKTVVAEDEGPKNARPEKIAALKPVFKKDGTVTAANASSINDGAAAVVLMSAERAKAEGTTVLGRITG